MPGVFKLAWPALLLSLCWQLLAAPLSQAAPPLMQLDVVHAGPRLVSVGERGSIVYSDDQGNHWQPAQVPTRQLLTAVYFVDALHGWAVGHDAQILASTDGGATWRLQFEDQSREAPLLDVWFQNDERGFAVGAYGALLGTTDGGLHWVDLSDQLDNPEQLHLNAIARVEGAGLFIAGEAGSVFQSTDIGSHWVRLPAPGAGSLLGISGTTQPGTLLVYGVRDNLFRSSDAGQHWQLITVPGLDAGLAGGSLQTDGSLVLVGNAGSVLRSSDNGLTFNLYQRPDHQALAAVTGAPGGVLLLAGQRGVQRAAANGAGLEQP